MRIKANRLGRGARRSKAPESVISEEPIRLAQALGWILFIGSPFIIILSIWADIDHHSKLEERLEWANAFTEISQVSARAELVADKKSLLYQLLYHVVASQHKAKINYLDPSTQESIPVLGRYAQDENTLKFPSGISVNAWKDTRAQAEFERRIGIATSSVGNSLIENADVDSICTAISNGITIAFGEELTKELGYQICAISKFLSGISSPGSWERSAWIVRCETSLDGNENAWEVDVKYQRGGGNGTVGSLIGISACKASPWPAGNSDEDMWTNQEAVWPEHFTSYDNDWPDIGFLSHSVPETVRWSPRMELAVLERELASAVSTAEQIQRTWKSAYRV